MLTNVYRRLFDAFGPQHWWPGDTRFEMIVGAMLTQNTSWKNVERAIHNLREADLLEPHALYKVPLEELEELIRPAGYFRVKARRLRSLLEFLVERTTARWMRCFRPSWANCASNCSMSTALGRRRPTRSALRGRAAQFRRRRVYPSRAGPARMDRFRRRLPPDSGLHEGELPRDVPMYNEFHALLVRLGKDFCRKTNPKCAECPLRELLPPGGPLEPE